MRRIAIILTAAAACALAGAGKAAAAGTPQPQVRRQVGAQPHGCRPGQQCELFVRSHRENPCTAANKPLAWRMRPDAGGRALCAPRGENNR
jgi:hypothetical protein